jgi:kynureninase
VRPDLAARLEPAVTGWAAHARPFAFEPGPIEYAAAPERFQSGTPNVPALYSARAGYEIVGEVGVAQIRAHSLSLTKRLVEHAQRRGYTLNTPRADAERGGSVVIDVPGSEGVAAELLRRGVIIDHRPGAGIRLAPHFYSDARDIDTALATLDAILDSRPVTGARLV